ncbi:hypothetical protein F0562_012949 [Nyssa sinensis]|uniref:Uncharacterized protein n=1 Tax=Nyssa sinensis TaxID=561372 RepID=A0A5J4ZWV9_9ASTE|nr:hypothetical protein F0562_012949 [Nyssa sinensis]
MHFCGGNFSLWEEIVEVKTSGLHHYLKVKGAINPSAAINFAFDNARTPFSPRALFPHAMFHSIARFHFLLHHSVTSPGGG